MPTAFVSFVYSTCIRWMIRVRSMDRSAKRFEGYIFQYQHYRWMVFKTSRDVSTYLHTTSRNYQDRSCHYDALYQEKFDTALLNVPYSRRHRFQRAYRRLVPLDKSRCRDTTGATPCPLRSVHGFLSHSKSH